MLIYFVPLLFAVAAIFLSSRRLEQFAILFSGTLLLIRDGVGYDYRNYVNIFERDISFPFAPLADVLQDIARFLMVPNGFMGLAALLGTGLILYMSRMSATPRMSVIVFFAFPFFFLESFTIVRQILAVLFTALSYQMLRHNRLVYSVIAFLIATSIHISAAVSLPLFMLVNPNLNWRYLLLFPVILGTVYAMTNSLADSRLISLYAESEQSGNYYLLVTGATIAPALILKNRELIICAILGFIVALIVSSSGGYVLNRLIVYFYVPLLFAPIRATGTKVSVYSLSMILLMSLLYTTALQVKIREPSNRFIPYVTII